MVEVIKTGNVGLLTGKVAAAPERRAELISLAGAFQARIADVGADALVLEAVGTPDELDALEELVRPLGIRELVRTGRVGLARPSTRAKRNGSLTTTKGPA